MLMKKNTRGRFLTTLHCSMTLSFFVFTASSLNFFLFCSCLMTEKLFIIQSQAKLSWQLQNLIVDAKIYFSLTHSISSFFLTWALQYLTLQNHISTIILYYELFMEGNSYAGLFVYQLSNIKRLIVPRPHPPTQLE